MEVLRGGAPLQLDISLAAPQPLVPLHLAGADPSFLVVAGVLRIQYPGSWASIITDCASCACKTVPCTRLTAAQQADLHAGVMCRAATKCIRHCMECSTWRLRVLRRPTTACMSFTTSCKVDATAPPVPTVLTYRVSCFLAQTMHLMQWQPGATGLVFTPCCEPYLASEYGGDYDTDSPVKLLDKLLYGMKQTPRQQVVLLSQVRLVLFVCPLSARPGPLADSLTSAGSLVRTRADGSCCAALFASCCMLNADLCLLTAGAGLRLDARVRGPVQRPGAHKDSHAPLFLHVCNAAQLFMQAPSAAVCGAGAQVQRGGSGEPAAPEPAHSCLHRALHALRPRLRGAGCLQQLAGYVASIGVAAHRSRQCNSSLVAV